MTDATSLVELAQARMAEGALDGALSALLEAWASVRDPSLADAIEGLSTHLARDRPALGGGRVMDLEQRWLERITAANAIDVGALLPSLCEIDSKRATARLLALEAHGPDPRITGHLCALALAPPYVSGSTYSFWKHVFRILRECPDPRVRDRLAGPSRLYPDTSMGERLEAARARVVRTLDGALQHIPVQLDAPGRQALAELSARLRTMTATDPDTGESLLTAVYEDPADPGRRQVLADYLLARGDPRGEFIALQFADARGTLDRAGRARMNALLAERGNDWLGGIGWALTRSSVEFTRGFVRRARIKTGVRNLDQLAGNSAWATVETLENAPISLIRNTSMPVLRALVWTDSQAAQALARPCPLPQIERLTVEFARYWAQRRIDAGESVAGELGHTLGLRDRLTGLRTLGLRAGVVFRCEHIEWTWRGPLGKRLVAVETIGAGVGAEDVAAVARSLRRTDTTVRRVVLQRHRERFELDEDPERPGRWRVRVGGADLRWEAFDVEALTRVPDLMIALDPALRDGDPDAFDEAREHLAAHGRLLD